MITTTHEDRNLIVYRDGANFFEIVAASTLGNYLFSFRDAGPESVALQSELARKHKIGRVDWIDGAAVFIDPHGVHHTIGRSLLVNDAGSVFPA